MPEFVTVEKVRDAIREAFAELDQCFDLSPEVMSHRPDHDDAWTAAEHLEHVSLANHFLLLTIRKGCRTALRRAEGKGGAGDGGGGSASSGVPAANSTIYSPPPEGESDLQLLIPIAIPGAFEWLPPMHMVPTGTRAPAEVREEIIVQRDECLELLAAMPRGEGRLCHIRMSVNKSGWLDMYQWLYFLAQHIRYHLALIEKVVAAVGGPAQPL